METTVSFIGSALFLIADTLMVNKILLWDEDLDYGRSLKY